MDLSAVGFIAKNRDKIGLFLNALSSLGSSLNERQSDRPKPDVIPVMIAFFEELYSRPKLFDERCPTSVEALGEDFVKLLTGFCSKDESNQLKELDSIFTMVYRFICEFEFLSPYGLDAKLGQIKEFVEKNLDDFEKSVKRDLIYSMYSMPVYLIKRFLHGDAVAEFRSFLEHAGRASQLKQEWDKEKQEWDKKIESQREEISAHAKNLEDYRTEYNFVGLVHGFEKIFSEKKTERMISFCSLLALAFLMVLPLCAEVYYFVFKTEFIKEHRGALVYAVPSLLSLQVLLVYFFRVVLLHFRGIVAQMLQLRLRMSLCQFIEAYSNYSVNIKKQDPGALDKFESIVFSGIVSSNEALPSAFDGAEQIAKLIRSARG